MRVDDGHEALMSGGGTLRLAIEQVKSERHDGNELLNELLIQQLRKIVPKAVPAPRPLRKKYAEVCTSEQAGP